MNIEHISRLLLAAAFVVGTALILIFKLSWIFEDRGLQTLILIIVPILVIGLYCLLACFVPEGYRPSYEMIGDNCYYLGFVFTLVSLAATLFLIYDPGVSRVGIEEETARLVSGFGVALSSTIFGIFLRVMLLRILPGVPQMDRETRRDLDLAVRDFRISLGMSIEQLGRSTVQATQYMKEQADAVGAVMVKSGEDQKRALEESVETLNGFSAEIIRSSDDVKQAVSVYRTSLLQESERDVEARRKSADAIEQANREILSGIVKGTEAIQEELRSNVAVYRGIPEAMLSSISQASSQASKLISASEQNAQQLADLSGEILKQVELKNALWREQTEAVGGLTDLTGRLTAEVTNLEIGLSRLLKQLDDVQKGMSTAVTPAVAQIAAEAHGFLGVLTDSADRLKNAADLFESASRHLVETEVQNSVANLVVQLEAAYAGLTNALIQLENMIAEIPRGRLFGIRFDRLLHRKRKGR